MVICLVKKVYRSVQLQLHTPKAKVILKKVRVLIETQSPIYILTQDSTDSKGILEGRYTFVFIR